MSGIKVLITDPNETLRESLAELLRSRFTVQTSGDGNEALSLLQDFGPDILVTDLMLPGIDGFYLLEQAYRMPSPPEIMVVTRHLSSYVQEKVLSFGIHSMLRKPYDLMAAEANVRAIAKRLPVAIREKETAAVSELLLRLGFQSHRAGYEQLLLAVPMFAKDTRQPVNKVIYTAVANQLDLSGPKLVERSIRAVIEDYWQCGNADLWNHLFPPESLRNSKYPTNKHFIARITEYIYREQKMI